ncbi:MAG: hypothetical protein M3198_01660 [Actinomycetota bacterium]|nr:hypothetical protein [Actinomycetota bacterium]
MESATDPPVGDIILEPPQPQHFTISCTRTSLKLSATCLRRWSVRWRLQPQRPLVVFSLWPISSSRASTLGPCPPFLLR